MKDLLAAERYARALFEIARLTHEDEEIEAELVAFSAALGRSPAIEKFLANPRLKVDEKRAFLGRIYQKRNKPFDETLLNFFTVLFRKNRFHLIHEITVLFKRIADEAQGQGTAQIRTARPLDPRFEEKIVLGLEKIAGYRITVKKELDPALLGGVFVQVKNRIIDGSVKNKIDLLRKELIARRTV